MFSKKDIDPGKMETVIGPDTLFVGDIRSKGFVRVDGRVEGSVTAEGVILGEKAAVAGDVTAQTVFVGGSVAGNVTASEALELQPHGQIRGDIHAPRLSIAEGAIFEGRCVMNAAEIAARTPDLEKVVAS